MRGAGINEFLMISQEHYSVIQGCFKASLAEYLPSVLGLHSLASSSLASLPFRSKIQGGFHAAAPRGTLNFPEQRCFAGVAAVERVFASEQHAHDDARRPDVNCLYVLGKGTEEYCFPCITSGAMYDTVPHFSVGL